MFRKNWVNRPKFFRQKVPELGGVKWKMQNGRRSPYLWLPDFRCLYAGGVHVCSTWSCYEILYPCYNSSLTCFSPTKLIVVLTSCVLWLLPTSVVLCLFVMIILYAFCFLFEDSIIIISNLQMSGSWNLVSFQVCGSVWTRVPPFVTGVS